MKRLLFLLLFCASAFALGPFPTPTVSGTIQVGSSAGLKGNAFVRFRLRNYAGFVPRVVGTGIIVQTQFDVRPSDSLGNFSTVIYSNDVIVPNTCGSGSTACTWWTVEYWNDGKISSSGNYCIPQTNPTYDLTSAVPCTTPPVPANPVPPAGTVTSVAFTGDDTVYNAVVPGSPITTLGTFAPTLHTHAANTFFAGPCTGPDAVPTFRTLCASDVPPSILFPMYAPDGSVSTPSYSWANETTMGFYRPSAHNLTFTADNFSTTFVDGDEVTVDNAGNFCFSASLDSTACARFLGYAGGLGGAFELQDDSGEFYAPLRIHKLLMHNGNLTPPSIDFEAAADYLISGVETTTPTSPAATFEKAYPKASKGWCTVDSSGTERCTQKTGTSPIVVTGDAISCPTCSVNNPIKVINATGPFTCSGDQSVCAFTLNWPTTFGDTNYTAVCNPVGPTNTSGSQSINNGGEGALTATTIDVYMTVNGTSSQSYSGWHCIGIHN